MAMQATPTQPGPWIPTRQCGRFPIRFRLLWHRLTSLALAACHLCSIFRKRPFGTCRLAILRTTSANSLTSRGPTRAAMKCHPLPPLKLHRLHNLTKACDAYQSCPSQETLNPRRDRHLPDHLYLSPCNSSSSRHHAAPLPCSRSLCHIRWTRGTHCLPTWKPQRTPIDLGLHSPRWMSRSRPCLLDPLLVMSLSRCLPI